MTAADVREPSTFEPKGDVRFLGSSARVRLRSTVEASGWALIMLPPLGPGTRGQLASRIEEAIESYLQGRGAAGPGVGTEADPLRMLEDQLYRARRIGVGGFTLALESLSGLVGSNGSLCGEDSTCLRFWSAAALHHPVALWLSPTDTELHAYGPPLPLRTLLFKNANSDSIEASKAPGDGSPPVTRAKTLTGTAGWHTLSRMIDDAQGPKPLAAIEKLFVEAYIPLTELLRNGEGNLKAKESIHQFSTSFEKSYREAFAAAKVTQKRPRMILDVPALSSRIARLHGARNIILVLVDGMRYDVGLRVEQLLQSELQGSGVMTERMLLWAALPTVTSVQIRLLDRGIQGLTDPLDKQEMRDAEMPIGRGRTASTIRRIRIGGREVHKLDVLQADLTASGLPEKERLDALAQAVTFPLARLASGLAPRTLMFVFGDHGFVLPATEMGTGPAEQAGARPEEVLVPGQAWILGRIH